MRVSIHAPARGATVLLASHEFNGLGFDPRSRTGSDALASTWRPSLSGFDPRSRTGSDPRSTVSRSTARPFRSTLPHGERLDGGERAEEHIEVSIHAPARGATIDRLYRRAAGPVSIHAPARGATPHRHIVRDFLRVSIHAPARGATRASARGACHQGGFDPRSRTGSDGPGEALDRDMLRFRSTLPHGERQDGDLGEMVLDPFRSTLPHGERPAMAPSPSAAIWFRSTLPHGERQPFSRA